jgi:hypothetical protein
MLASVCDVLDAGAAPACGREIIVGGDGVFPPCTENVADCVRDLGAHHFPFTYGANRMGGVHPGVVNGLALTGAGCLDGNAAACASLPYIHTGDLEMSKTKVALLASLRKGTFADFVATRVDGGGHVYVQIPVIEDADCGNPPTGLEPDRLVAGFVTLDIREVVAVGARRERFLRAVLTCGVTIDAPGDGPEDFGTSGGP